MARARPGQGQELPLDRSHGGRGPRMGTICYIPRNITKELDWKQSSEDMNCYPYRISASQASSLAFPQGWCLGISMVTICTPWSCVLTSCVHVSLPAVGSDDACVPAYPLLVPRPLAETVFSSVLSLHLSPFNPSYLLAPLNPRLRILTQSFSCFR